MLAPLSPAQLTQILYSQALEFSGGVLDDDLALLAIRLQPASLVGSLPVVDAPQVATP